MQALLRHVDNEDADEAYTVAVTASARSVAQCNMECSIGYDAVARLSLLL